MPSTPAQPDPAQLREAQRLLALSADALFEDLGRSIGERGLPEDLIRAGRARYRAIVEKCQAAICGNDTIRVLATDKNSDRSILLVCTIAAAIVPAVGITVPAMTVAAILVQAGLEKVCAAQWR